jgi:hypothetical protein
MRARLVWASLVFVVGCRGEGTTPQPQGSPTASASPAAKPSTLAKLKGTWAVKLSDRQEHDLATMRLVFEDNEPSAERLAALAPDERATIMAIREARKKSPDDPQYKEMRAVLDDMGRSTLSVYTTSISLVVGTVRQDADIVVKTETATSVSLSATTRAGRTEEVELGIVNDGVITMAKPNQREALTFSRTR